MRAFLALEAIARGSRGQGFSYAARAIGRHTKDLRRFQSYFLATLLRDGRDLLNANRFLCRIEFASHGYVRGREVPHSFRIFDDPDSLVIVGYEDGSLRFPFRMSH